MLKILRNIISGFWKYDEIATQKKGKDNKTRKEEKMLTFAVNWRKICGIILHGCIIAILCFYRNSSQVIVSFVTDTNP